MTANVVLFGEICRGEKQITFIVYINSDNSRKVIDCRIYTKKYSLLFGCY